MKLFIRAYGSHLMGMGHLYRIKKIIDHIKSNGNFKITLWSKDFKEANLILEKLNVDNLILIPSNINEEEEIKLLKNHFSNNYYYDRLINDQLNTSKYIAEVLTKNSKFSITFDDLGEGNILFNKIINVLYPTESNLDNEINSFDYLILDNYSKIKKYIKFKEKVKKIFINQGAADTWGAIPDLLKDLHNLDLDLELKVLLGPSFKHFNELCKVLKNIRKKVEIINFSNNVIDLVKDCDLAIVGGGNTLFEIASLGIPIIAVTREEKELITISRLLKYNLIYGNESLYDSNIQYLIKDVIFDTNGRKEKYLLTRRTFNYEGLNKITNLLLKGEK